MTALSYGRDRLGRWPEAATLEWLVTNGVGGYAAGTVSGALTRRGHGLLVAALEPPLGRVLLLAKLAERVALDGVTHDLDANLWASGVVRPSGFLALESFRLEDTVPAWTWTIGDQRLEKRVWMEQGENATWVQYRLSRGRGPALLTLRALVNARPLPAPLARGTGEGRVEIADGSARIEVREGAPPLWLVAPGAAITPLRDWYRGFALAGEREGGEPAVEDHLCAAELRVMLEPGATFTLLASARSDAATRHGGPLARGTALARRRMHEKSLLEMWRAASPEVARTAPEWIRTLTLAADSFIAERASRLDPAGRTILAGFPGPGDGGRDAMIALPGLALATGRPEVARAVLATFARHVDQGMLPGHFAENGAAPEYDSVDAGLWYFQAVRAYVEATGDDAFLESVYPVLEEIGAWCERGTRYGIGMDPEDALLRAGAPGIALTWMDAGAGERPATDHASRGARAGKPVEVNALWYSALLSMVELAGRLGRPAENTEALAARVARGFERYWNPVTRALHDVLDGPDGDDPALRPNQLLAISLPHSPLPRGRQRAVLDRCGRWLLTSHGLRSLAPCESGYRGMDAGPDAAHQGAAWTWLLPHWALAVFRVTGDREAARSALEPLGELVRCGVVGMLPGVADGDPPHAPRGVLAQAWSVGEALRAWHLLHAARPAARRHAPRRRAAEELARV